MSVDVMGPNDRLQPYGRGSRSSLTGRERTPITDLVVIFGGWGGSGGVQRLNSNPSQPTGTSQLLQRVQRLTGTPGRNLRVLGFEGSLMLGSNEPLRIIRSIFHPSMKIILYGYSAGGGNANVLAWQIWQNMRYYEFPTGNFYSMLGVDAFQRSTVGITRVDLLITVDAAVGPGSASMFRNVAPAVRRNVNSFQTYPASRERSSGIHTGANSHGGPNAPLWPHSTQIDNRNLSNRYQSRQGEAHGRIDNDTLDDSYQLIRGTLGFQSDGVPNLAPAGSGFG